MLMVLDCSGQFRQGQWKGGWNATLIDIYCIANCILLVGNLFGTEG